MRWQTATIALFLTVAPRSAAAEPNLADRFYDAIRGGDNKAVAQLLSDGADVNTRGSHGDTILMYAAAMGSTETMRTLIAAGADVNAKNDFDSTAIMWCSNNLAKVRLLTDKGANVNAHSKLGRTPLEIAAAHDGNIDVIRLLIEKGADLKAPTGGANSASIAAAQANDTAMVKLMLDRGADAKAKDPSGFTALMNAAGNGNVELVKLLLSRGADVNA